MSSRTNIWFPVYVGDYKTETMGLTHEERGIFVELLVSYWHTQAPLPDDDKRMSKIVGVSLQKWKAVRPNLAPLFVIKNGCWHFQRLEAEAGKAAEISAARRRAGHIGGKKTQAIAQANAQASAFGDSQANAKAKLKTYTVTDTNTGSNQEREGIGGGLEGERLAEFVAKGGGDL